MCGAALRQPNLSLPPERRCGYGRRSRGAPGQASPKGVNRHAKGTPYPVLSTLFNWGRASLGTNPFVIYGAKFGPAGLLIGQASGSVIFGTLAVITAFRVVGRLGRADYRHGNGIAIPAGTGNTALATLAVRPWRDWHLPLHRHMQGSG